MRDDLRAEGLDLVAKSVTKPGLNQPQGAEPAGNEAVSEREAALAGVEDDALLEALAEPVPKERLRITNRNLDISIRKEVNNE